MAAPRRQVVVDAPETRDAASSWGRRRPKTLRLVWDGPFTLVNARGGHWWANQAEDAMLRRWAAMAGADSGMHFTGPVVIEALMTVKAGVLPDCGAISLAVKHVIDGLVDADVLVDDSPGYVRGELYHAPERGDRRSLIVLVKEHNSQLKGPWI